MAGGLVAGILGPGIASFARDLLPEARFAGSYLTIIGLYAIIALLLMFVRLPPMSSGLEGSVKRPLSLVFRQPKLIAALTSASLGYAVMALVMTATPLAMTHHHHEFPDAALVIQWHVVGMYAPSFFTGNLIQRFGAVRIMALGVLLNVICVGINLSGQTWWHFWVALILLGVGWNFMFVGGTSLLTETYLPEEKATVQGVNDLIVFALAATGSLMAGVLLNLFGWQWVNLLALPILALAFGVLGWYARTLSTQEAAEATPS
jgi:MFS family permease